MTPTFSIYPLYAKKYNVYYDKPNRVYAVDGYYRSSVQCFRFKEIEEKGGYKVFRENGLISLVLK